MLLFVFAGYLVADYYKQCGSGCSYSCPPEFPVIVQLCASGDDVACGDETNMFCSSMAEIYPEFNKSLVSSQTSYHSATGIFQSCSDSEYMCATCGSHSHPDCSGGIFAVGCCTPEYPIFMKKGSAYKFGATTNHVTGCNGYGIASGHCSSGKGHDCSGGTNQLQCSKMVDCTPTKISGKWIIQKVGSSVGEKVVTIVGVGVTDVVALLASLHKNFEIEISKGFNFENIHGKSVTASADVSKTIAAMAGASFEISTSVISEAWCDFAPFVLYQFQITIEGSCGEKVFLDAYACTKTRATPPCCLPGYALDSYSQVCYPGSPNLCSNTTSEHIKHLKLENFS